MKPLQYDIIIDSKENPKKCTIHPIKDRSDFSIQMYQNKTTLLEFNSDCLLHVDGKCLSTFRKKDCEEIKRLGLIDSHWQRVPDILNSITNSLPRLIKIPSDFITGYPRKSKNDEDPEGGLATIEALFIAAAFLGNWDESLLEKYYFKDDFLTLNSKQFLEYGLKA